MPPAPTTNFLRAIRLLRDKAPDPDAYPLTVPFLKNFSQIDLTAPVVFFIGENGTGKSTFLEALAVGSGFNAEGGGRNFNFATRDTHSELFRYLRITRSPYRASDGFFLRAESFYNLATNIDQLDTEPDLGPPVIRSYGGRSLHEVSHGESFFALLMHRLRGDGLYILDEPEAALSPMRQMAMLSRLRQLVDEGSQFIIATHSPILMAYPGAQIFVCGEDGLRLSAYEDTEHYKITRRFLNNPQAMLDILMARDG